MAGGVTIRLTNQLTERKQSTRKFNRYYLIFNLGYCVSYVLIGALNLGYQLIRSVPHMETDGAKQNFLWTEWCKNVLASEFIEI